MREGFEPRAIDRFDAAAIEFDRVGVLQAQQRAGGHIANGTGGRGDLRLREIFDAGRPRVMPTEARAYPSKNLATRCRTWANAKSAIVSIERRRACDDAIRKPRASSASLRAAWITASLGSVTTIASVSASARVVAPPPSKRAALVERVVRQPLADRVRLAVGREQRVDDLCPS